ncbi:MAG: 30S ribosomal protein S1 [Pelagibacteraceae bacterium TMED237]|nr:MAG: 30S ribosomal protein S1 [Pelagibacteraceae bacterium TMED237]|tara:strand:- start:6645 stop:8345 length:1701 start_codon:yes stop_codon:yes gene_type:complete
MNQENTQKISNTEYDDLISSSFKNTNVKEKTIIKGKIVSIENDIVIVDVGLKSEGRVPINEFGRPGQKPEINVGEEVEVFIENVDNAYGETTLSREKAVKQKAWYNLQDSFDNNKVVTGVPFNRVKGGMSVDLDGVTAFLPGSQIDTRQIIKDTKELLNKPLELLILKMDKYRGNIVVSRKAITENELKEQRKELLDSIEEGSIIEGKVKNITDYGAFIDLGGMDGLVHVTDISWTKINNPSEILELNQKIKVKVLKFDEELSRLSLGIKQLSENPWDSVNEKVKVDEIINCKIISINDNHVNIIIKEIYDGTISLNELTWLKKPPHPNKIVNINDEVEVKILEIDEDKKKINCSLKQMRENPWKKLKDNYNINDSFETEIVNVVDFGIFVKVQDEIDGMVHVSDLSWEEKECAEMLKNSKKGDQVKVKILDINVEKERISLGIKHLNNDPFQEFIEANPLKSKITGKILEVDEKGLKIELDSEKKIFGFIKKINLSKDKNEQKTERFAVGENIDSIAISLDNKTRIINLSIKELEIQDEKEVLSKYGSSASGASLGDILGSVLKK